MDDLNAISVDPIYLRYPDDNERLTYMMLAGWLADQQEMDKICCETS
jgi:hypothetical protein